MTTPSYDPHAPNNDPAVPLNTDTRLDGQVILVDYDPAWQGMYAREERRIREALGDRALLVEHMGSTSVPGLCAKPCIDIVLGVEDPADESTYVPALQAAGYVLRRREPEWHEHRVFKGSDINLNLHVWPYGDPIIGKHLAFRDWLRAHPDDRDLYAAEKRRLASQHWTLMNDYAEAKSGIVREIERRMWAQELQPMGRVVRLQVQREKIKTGQGADERYTPHQHLLLVTALHVDSGGVTGITESGEPVADVHHRDHPRSRFRGENGISLGFTGHYAQMRERFGDHLVDGIAGEGILVDHDGTVSLDDLATGIVITSDDGRIIAIDTWEVAHPCAPFSKFCLRFPDGQKADRRVTEALQFLEDGTRGFNGTYRPDQPKGVEIRLGDTVFRRR
jgi:GrpB-like predicted nucleotidyltransferase (UPF0157 family)